MFRVFICGLLGALRCAGIAGNYLPVAPSTKVCATKTLHLNDSNDAYALKNNSTQTYLLKTYFKTLKATNEKAFAFSFLSHILFTY